MKNGGMRLGLLVVAVLLTVFIVDEPALSTLERGMLKIGSGFAILNSTGGSPLLNSTGGSPLLNSTGGSPPPRTWTRAVLEMRTAAINYATSVSSGRLLSLAGFSNTSSQGSSPPAPLREGITSPPASSVGSVNARERDIPRGVSWKEIIAPIARQAYRAWKKVQDSNEPDTVAGVISRLNNTSFRWVSQKIRQKPTANKDAKPCSRPPCYEDKLYGGDDYFVLITTAGFREHVATCTDHDDGTYTFRFDATCGEEVVGNMSVLLEFSHGHSFTPDKKEEYLKRIVLLHAPNTMISADPIVRQEEMTVRRDKFVQAPGLFEKFETIVAFGCSLTHQITSEAMRRSGRKIYYVTAASPLTSHLLDAKFKAPLKQWAKMYNTTKDKSKFAVIFNSGVWDVLLPVAGSELNHSPEDMYADHLQALSDWADYVRAEFPEAAIFFKETTFLHAHVTMCSFIQRPKLKYKCRQRNMYMAGALTNLLRRLQNAMMVAKNIPILLQYDATFRHPSFALDGDGRHFSGELNDLMWKSWSYIDGRWTTQLLCPGAFNTWMGSVHPEHNFTFSQGLARSYERGHIAQ